MTGGARTTVITLALLALLCIAASAAELIAITYAKTEGPARWSGLQSAEAWSPLNWSYPQQSAAVERASGQIQASQDSSRRAIALYPACAQCWIQVAENQAVLGEDPVDAVERAVGFGRSMTEVRTRAAVLWAQMGDDERALGEFRASLHGVREERDDTFRILHRLYPAEWVLDRVVTDDDLGPYFAFVRKNESHEFADVVWERYSALAPDPVQKDEYIGDLLQAGYVRRGWEVAFDASPLPAGGVLAGDFQDPLDYGRFGWHVSNGEGVKARIRRCPACTPTERALQLAFDGDNNSHYYGASQVVPIQSSTHYALRARVSYEGLTSARGPQLILVGIGSEGGDEMPCRLRVLGEEFHGDSDWRETEVFFTVPAACEGLRIFVARARTKHLDRYIEGELWVDDVRLELLGAAPEEPCHPTLANFPPTAG